MGIHGQKRFQTFLIETLLDDCRFNYQTIRRSCGEIPVAVSFRRPYRKGPTCSHPEHSSQAFRADDSAYQRESRYCRILKKPFDVRVEGLFLLPPTQPRLATGLAVSLLLSAPTRPRPPAILGWRWRQCRRAASLDCGVSPNFPAIATSHRLHCSCVGALDSLIDLL